jgi:hypothetical protein
VNPAQVRIESLACFLVKEAPGTEGKRSECWRMVRFNPKFRKGLGFIQALAATKTGEVIVDPLQKLKLSVERLIKEYEFKVRAAS